MLYKHNKLETLSCKITFINCCDAFVHWNSYKIIENNFDCIFPRMLSGGRERGNFDHSQGKRNSRQGYLITLGKMSFAIEVFQSWSRKEICFKICGVKIHDLVSTQCTGLERINVLCRDINQGYITAVRPVNRCTWRVFSHLSEQFTSFKSGPTLSSGSKSIRRKYIIFNSPVHAYSYLFSFLGSDLL